VAGSVRIGSIAKTTYAVFPMTIHPDVSGRPQVLMMLERLYKHIASHPGVRFVT